MSLNQFIIDGNLTRAPEVRYTPRGTPVCSFTVAVNTVHGSGDERREETAFIPVTTYGRLADTSSRNLRKGAGVTVIGRLGSWFNQDSKKGGFTFEAERVIFRHRGQRAAEGNTARDAASPATGPAQGFQSADAGLPDPEWVREFDAAAPATAH